MASRYYFNYILFAPIWAARRVIDIFRIALKSEGDVNNPILNCVLKAVFDFDVATARVVRPPFDVSALVIAKRS